MYDAVVVGSGPAGSSVALRLARRGMRVALLERSYFPRTKVCGEYLSPGALAGLDSLGLFGAVAARAQRITTITLAGFGAGPISLPLPHPGAFSLPRADFDLILRDAAISAGAELITGAYLGNSNDSDTLGIDFRDEHGRERRLSASTLVGADGAWSSVAQRNGLSGERRNGGRWAVGGHVRDDEPSDVLEMYAGAGGYFARNPLGGGLVNEMLVMPRPTPDDQLDAVAAEISDRRRGFDRARLVKRVAVGPLRYRATRAALGRVILSGDAACLLDPFTGQGVSVALALSAPAASAAAAIAAGEDPNAVARRYAAKYWRIVAPRRRICWLVGALVRVSALRRLALARYHRDPRWTLSLMAAVAGAP